MCFIDFIKFDTQYHTELTLDLFQVFFLFESFPFLFIRKRNRSHELAMLIHLKRNRKKILSLAIIHCKAFIAEQAERFVYVLED